MNITESMAALNLGYISSSSLQKVTNIDKIDLQLEQQTALKNSVKTQILESLNATISGSRINDTQSKELGSSLARYATLSKDGAVLSGVVESPTRYEISNGIDTHSYFEQIGASDFHMSVYDDKNAIFAENRTAIVSADTKIHNINEYGLSSILKTAYGDVKVFFDPFDDGDKMGAGEINANMYLINFDTTGDGVLDINDENFSKLKVRGYDIDGNEKVARLSDVVRQINLVDFIKTEIINKNQENIKAHNADMKNILADYLIDPNKFDYRISHNASNPYALFKPEYRYKEMSEAETDELFSKLAGPDGWINLRGNGVFHEKSQYINFAYAKLNLDGKEMLNEFNSIISEKNANKREFSYINYQKQSFMTFYKDYKSELNEHNEKISKLSNELKSSGLSDADELIKKLSSTKSARLNAMEREFEQNTGMKMSLRNLESLKRRFDNDPKGSAHALKDTDAVVAMKRENDGRIRLKFDSGRELVVDKIYEDTGKLNDVQNGKRKSAFVKKLDIKIAPVPELGVQNLSKTLIEAEFKAFWELGVNEFKMGEYDSKFYLMAQKLNQNELFTLSSLERLFNNDLIKFSEIKPEDKFYQKIDVYV
ncbi:response regulator [Campylobacter suis]|uniref:Uncharacterized protein n=1 Tax=Campylobacter suis TaxID=2790657 RepID=A0ABM8Q6Q0_9BACT|nr:response regulator [Campylobacter suis]CAD7288549.1 hypothetical protein LMG8286_01390 [Campylobacter suis]